MTALSLGAIVLCGGESRRMGMPKALLPFGDELLLERIVRVLDEMELVKQIVVVKAAEQELPPLADEIIMTEDRQPGRGPLEGLVVGLQALGQHVDAAYVTSCDAPLLQTRVVRRLWELLGDNDIVVPSEQGRYHPLSAIYRVSVQATAEQLLADDQRRPAFLFDRVSTCSIDVEELRDLDPDLNTFRNVNEPADYIRLLHDAGHELTDEIAARLKSNQAH